MLHNINRVKRLSSRDPNLLFNRGTNRQVYPKASALAESGFDLREARDVTPAMASVAERWRKARASRRGALATLEGEPAFDGVQRFLEAVHVLASERRLSRFAYLAAKHVPA